MEGRLGGGQQGIADYSLHPGSERPPGGTEHAGGMGRWAEITHQDPADHTCGSWELRFVNATPTHFF